MKNWKRSRTKLDSSHNADRLNLFFFFFPPGFFKTPSKTKERTKAESDSNGRFWAFILSFQTEQCSRQQLGVWKFNELQFPQIMQGDVVNLIQKATSCLRLFDETLTFGTKESYVKPVSWSSVYLL